MSTDSHFLLLGAVSALIAVTVGGARAHFLDKRISPERLPLLEVGMRYQMAHSMALMITSFVVARFGGALPVLAGYGFVLGILFTSGSMYAFALSGRRALLRLTPVGGVMFMAGWGCFAAAALFSPG